MWKIHLHVVINKYVSYSDYKCIHTHTHTQQKQNIGDNYKEMTHVQVCTCTQNSQSQFPPNTTHKMSDIWAGTKSSI